MDITNFENQERYNLFVFGNKEEWESTCIMTFDRCLTSYTSPEIKNEFSPFDDEAIRKVMMYPCIVKSEDGDYRKTDAYIGYITEIKIRNAGIKFRFNKIGKLSSEDLHSLTFRLEIRMPKGITELMHTHWTIKNVNLFEELNDKGISFLEPIKPTVFISYCWSPSTNKAKVMQLAERLILDGVNVLYDENSLHPGQDIIFFMESLASNSEIKKVLVICNSEYARKADTRQGGVGTESEIIIPQVYGAPMQNKIVPIYFEKDSYGKPFCPSYLKTKWAIDLTNGYEEYDKLLKDIFQP